MEECSVCKHGMKRIGRIRHGIQTFVCPNCQYMKNRESKRAKKEKGSNMTFAKKLRFTNLNIEHDQKTTTNGAKVAVSKKEERL